tara:strand:- start:5092 stop:5871 length:780 start_codon:yes stop_codon:yes gene_type:complete
MSYLNNFSFIVSSHNSNLPALSIYEKYAKSFFKLDVRIKKYLICEDYYNKESYFDYIIKNKPGKNWSQQLIDSISNIKTEYIIFCLEDFIFYKEVDMILFNSYLFWINKNKANYFRLMPKPKGFKKIDENIYELGRYALYKSSLFFTVWNKNLLLRLLKKFDNPWKFEVLGSRYVRDYNKFYTVNKKFIYIHHIVAKNLWINRNLNYLNVDDDILKQKQRMNLLYESIWTVKKNILSLFELIPDNFIKYYFYYLFKSYK